MMMPCNLKNICRVIEMQTLTYSSVEKTPFYLDAVNHNVMVSASLTFYTCQQTGERHEEGEPEQNV